MKKGLMAFMLALASMTAFAQRQSDQTAEQRAENQTKNMTGKLALNPDQQKQVYTLNLDRAKKMEELRNSATRDREAMRASMEAFNTELSKVLTPEQQEKYKALQEERRANGRRPGN